MSPKERADITLSWAVFFRICALYNLTMCTRRNAPSFHLWKRITFGVFFLSSTRFFLIRKNRNGARNKSALHYNESFPRLHSFPLTSSFFRIALSISSTRDATVLGPIPAQCWSSQLLTFWAFFFNSRPACPPRQPQLWPAVARSFRRRLRTTARLMTSRIIDLFLK